jgi:hypothetical protein
MDRLVMRFALAVGLVLVAVIFLTGAAGFLCAALYLHLASLMSPAAAAALTGLAALIVMAVLLILGRLVLAKPAPQLPVAAAAAPLDEAQITQALTTLLGGELGKSLLQHPKSGAAIALAAGLAMGLSPALRGLLVGLIGTPHRTP